MKRVSFVIILIAALLLSCVSPYAQTAQEQDVKQAVKQYFDLRYRILSNLVYDDTVKSLLAPEILNSKEAISEADVLETIVKYRKSQINDLRFSRYEYSLEYGNIEITGEKARLALNEKCDLYFNCAPTVKNSIDIGHTMALAKVNSKWLIVKDDYTDSDGVKKAISRYFLENNATLEEAKKRFLSESESQANGRINELQTLMEGVKDKKLLVFSIGKPVAYADGTSGRIDSISGLSPTVVDGRTLLPVRYTGEKLGASVTWDDKTSTAKITGNGITVEIKTGEKTMLANGKQITLDVPAQIINGRTMVPLRALAEALGKKVFWDDNGLIILSDDTFDKDANKTLINKLAEYFNVLFTKADFPRIDGSTATYPLSMEIGKKLLGLDEIGVKGFITHNTTHNAYVNLIDGKADIIFVTEPSSDEYELARQKGVELEVVPICKEGFVFLVNKDNSVNNLTVKQVQDIYQGKIKNWKEVGGDDNDIIPYQREANSGSQTIMTNTVMKGLKIMQPPKETLVYGMGELIDRVADYSNAKNALGYSVYYYATTMYKNRDVKLISINGFKPDKQTIKDGTYPFTVGYYAVLRKDEPSVSNARKLLGWLLGEEGQTIVDRAGLVQVK